MKHICMAALIVAGAWAFDAPASAAELQGKSLLGEPLYITQQIGFPPAQMENLVKAIAEAKSDFEKSVTPDTATWYARLLMYQNHILDSIAVLDRGLKQYPTSGKLLRHRAEHVLLRTEMQVERGLGNPCFARDVVDRRAPVAITPEQRAHGAHDLIDTQRAGGRNAIVRHQPPS